MLKLFLFFMMFNSIIMTSLQTPLIMGALLIMQTILSCLVMRLMTYSSWIPFTLFLMMVSGLMIIFIYMTSICSNNKFNSINWKLILYLPVIMFILAFKQKLMIKDSYQLKDIFNYEFFKLYTPMNINSSLFMFIYLLLTLIMMVNLLSHNKGPLRKKY